MQDCVAVKTDDVDCGSTVLVQKMLDRLGMKFGQIGLDRGDGADAAEDRAQPLAKLRRIGNGQRRAGRHPVAAVGLDHRDIDAVE